MTPAENKKKWEYFNLKPYFQAILHTATYEAREWRHKTSHFSCSNFERLIYQHLFYDMREMIEVIAEGEAVTPPQA